MTDTNSSMSDFPPPLPTLPSAPPSARPPTLPPTPSGWTPRADQQLPGTQPPTLPPTPLTQSAMPSTRAAAVAPSSSSSIPATPHLGWTPRADMVKPSPLLAILARWTPRPDPPPTTPPETARSGATTPKHAAVPIKNLDIFSSTRPPAPATNGQVQHLLQPRQPIAVETTRPTTLLLSPQQQQSKPDRLPNESSQQLSSSEPSSSVQPPSSQLHTSLTNQPLPPSPPRIPPAKPMIIHAKFEEHARRPVTLPAKPAAAKIIKPIQPHTVDTILRDTLPLKREKLIDTAAVYSYDSDDAGGSDFDGTEEIASDSEEEIEEEKASKHSSSHPSKSRVQFSAAPMLNMFKPKAPTIVAAANSVEEKTQNEPTKQERPSQKQIHADPLSSRAAMATPSAITPLTNPSRARVKLTFPTEEEIEEEERRAAEQQAQLLPGLVTFQGSANNHQPKLAIDLDYQPPSVGPASHPISVIDDTTATSDSTPNGSADNSRTGSATFTNGRVKESRHSVNLNGRRQALTAGDNNTPPPDAQPLLTDAASSSLARRGSYNSLNNLDHSRRTGSNGHLISLPQHSPSNSSSSSVTMAPFVPPPMERRGSMFGVSGTGPLAPRLAQNILLQLDQLMMSTIPTEAFEQLESLKATMQLVQSIILAQEADAVEPGTDVEVLTGILKTQGAFDDTAVAAYRAAAGAFQHGLYAFTAWSCPQYFSVSPLPLHVRSVNIVVHLPVEHFPVLGGGKANMKFDIEVFLNDTVDVMMRRTFIHYNELLPPLAPLPVDPSVQPPPLDSLATRLVCRIAGFKDFLLPSHRVFEYESIRHCVRNKAAIEILIVERPPELRAGCKETIMPQAVWDEINEWRKQYEAKIERYLQPVDRDDYIDTGRSFQMRLSSSSAIIPVKRSTSSTGQSSTSTKGLNSIPITELSGVPFRLRILGLERVNLKTLPRLGNTTIFGPHVSPASESVELFVRVYLIHGMSKLNHGPSSQTPLIRYDSSAPRFTNTTGAHWTNQPWILPPPANQQATHLSYSRLPRATRVLFLLYATPAVSSSSSSTNALSPIQLSASINSPGAIAGDEHDPNHPLIKRSSVVNLTPAASAAADKSKDVASPINPPNDDGVGVPQSTVKKEAKLNEVLLGWSACQLIDEFGELRTGKLEMHLWTSGCGLNEKDYNYGSLTHHKEDLNQIMRNTNKHNPIPATNSVTTAIEPKSPSHDHHNSFSSSSSSLAAALGAASPSAFTGASLTVEFDQFALRVVAPLVRRTFPSAYGTTQKMLNLSMHPKSLDKLDRKQFTQIMHSDPLYTLTSSDRELIWLTRSHLVYHPHMLPKFLLCIDWTNPPIVAEAYKLLKLWSPPLEAVSALELLDAKYPDLTVREYAVNILDTRMSDSELQLYLLQLVQCLKFESYHDSPLSRFLLRRSLANPLQIGHHFFWHCKAEVGTWKEWQERYTIILEEYLSFAGLHARELRKQNNVVQKLQKIAELIVKLKVEDKVSDAEATKEYHARLTKLNRDFFSKLDGGSGGKFQIPLNPKLEAKGLIVEKCKFMSSKKVPLWLVFENADPAGKPIYIIFKSGDDLRQDILTLQLLKVMDKMWLDVGLDCRLMPYKCIATGVNDLGEGVGMIEVVLGSDTTSGIQLKYGGGAFGALKSEPLDRFLRDHNTPGPAYDLAVENFVRSCAGYCVATFVLGIGDRHNGNIMVTQAGHLFHIDFGHFLGNFKKKFGFNRERSAFVFTPEMAYVMGGKNYKKSPLFKLFKECCFKGFNVLRKHAAILENLFLLMCSAGMPELMEREDVLYLRDMLCLDSTDRQAERRFKDEIKNSLDGVWRRLDNLIHNAKHGN